MIKASSEFKHLVRNGAKLVNYADIILRNGTVLNLEPSDFSIGGFSLADKTTNGKFEIGTAIAKTINITIANHTNKFSAYDFYKSIIYIYVAVEKEDGTVLKERKGKYYVVNPATPNDTINLSGLDSMYLFDKPFASDLPFPATLEQLLSVCCTDCGVNIGFGQFNNWNMVVYNRPTDCTYRQVVSWIAQIAGYNARISVEDALELVWYDLAILNQNIINGGNFLAYDEETTYDGGDFTSYESDVIIDGGLFTDEVPLNVTKISSLSVSTDDVIITGVRVQNDDVSAFVGTEDYVIEIKDNPLTGGVENAVAEYLAPLLIGLTFRPLSCQTTNNPFFEPYDVCYVYDRKGNGYFTLINSVSYSISGFTTIACNADDPVRNESSYTSEFAKAVAQAKRNTEAQLTLYDKAVQNMNMLAANAMGLYRESETQSDGSVIYFMSNRPIIKNENGICEFELDSVVYKMTGDGFFVSEDGGLSYTSGFDANGNAVVNVLSAIGITFDWARGGTLSLGGADNQNGRLLIFDANNKQVGQIDNAGLAFYSDTTKTQFILSPIYGLIQRDADGNEYNGFIHDVVIRTNKVDGVDLVYNYNAYCTNKCNVELYHEFTKVEVEVMGWGTTYRKYRYVATDHSIYWKPESEVTSIANQRACYDLVLPERFHGKDWLVLLIFDGWNTDIESFEYTQVNNYGTEIPNVYDGQSWTDDYYSYYQSYLFPATSDSKLGIKTLSVENGNVTTMELESYGYYDNNGNIISTSATTPVISHMTSQKATDVMTPDYGSVVTQNITSAVAVAYNAGLVTKLLPEPILSYMVLDSKKTTLRIYCKASLGNYNISQMANIRVIVSA